MSTPTGHYSSLPAQAYDKALKRIGQLVVDFGKNEKHYLSPDYLEAHARLDFIDKFWIALGWDVNHEQQKNPYEQEVKVERNVNVKGRKKKADYAFLAPNFRDVRFFVEAKKPARNIDNPDDYFQTIRYGWNAQTPLSILTDFEQFRLLDCRYKPDVQVAMQRAVKKFHYTEYTDEEKFREIYFLFSHEAVADGALEKYAATLPKPTGKATKRRLFGEAYKTVDEDFLQELDDLREELARSFKNRNQHLNGEDLTEATQRTLDRLVFMRFLEDKLIESEAIVERLGERGLAWSDFVVASARLNKIYNGIIFKPHFIDKANFVVEEHVFASVRERLAHTNTVYNFNYIPIHVLGSIYERFLGKVIVTTGRQAKVVEKPEVRKAGGVYYTPEYIVRYIVKQTIGKLIEAKTPEEIAEMRFADIACGSGSFLLGVYDELLRYHTAYYNEPKNHRKAIKAGCIENPGESLGLSLNQRKDILLNNIYGVDLDAQAVEVAQLSLFLKLLEDETTASAKGFQLHFRETMLPSLERNVVHGNSLIDWDIGAGNLFDDEEQHRLFPLNFNDKFPGVMQRGGFDAIVGNPPYIRMEVFKDVKSYLKKNYDSHNERSDIYTYFIERAHKLLKENGRYGAIVSNKFLRANYGNPLREFLRRKTYIERIVDFAGLPVFAGATVRTVVLLTSLHTNNNRVTAYSPPPTDTFAEIVNGRLTVEKAITGMEYEVDAASLAQPLWSFAKRDKETLFSKLQRHGDLLKNYCGGQICMGVKSGLTEAFVIDAAKRDELLMQNTEAAQIIKPLLNGRDVRRYQIEYQNIFLIYTHHGINIKKYPAVEAHLRRFKQRLEKRATKQAWYELQQPQFRFAPLMEGAKIIFPDIATTPRFALDETGFYSSNTTYFIPRRDLYLLALLNSRLGHFYFSFVCAGLEGKTETYLRFFGQYLDGFPVRTINFSDKADCACHNRMVALVEGILTAKRQFQIARTDRDRNFYENKYVALGRQIDILVYKLYDLTDEEVAIIESTYTIQK
jgi:adenine-specific DNA-methyltransferase